MNENDKIIDENLGYEELVHLRDIKAKEETDEQKFSLDLDKLGLNSPKEEKEYAIDEPSIASIEEETPVTNGPSPKPVLDDKAFTEMLDAAIEALNLKSATFSDIAKEITQEELNVEDYSEGLNKVDDIALDPSRLFSKMGEPSFELHPDMWKTSSDFEEEEEVKPRSR